MAKRLRKGAHGAGKAQDRLRRLREKIRNIHLPDDAGLKTIILVKGVKAVVMLVLGLGALYLVGQDLAAFATWLAKGLNLDIKRRGVEAAFDSLAKVTPGQVKAVAIGAIVFSAWNTFEAVGLHYRKEWVAWCSIALGCVFMVFEGYHVVQHATVARVLMFAANTWIVWYLFQKVRHHDLEKRVRSDLRRLLERGPEGTPAAGTPAAACAPAPAAAVTVTPAGR